MFFILRWLLFLAILFGIALVAYAYVGPIFGVEFSPPPSEVRTPIELNVD